MKVGRKNIKKGYTERGMPLLNDDGEQNTYGDSYYSIVLEQWKTCVEMANSNTEKRSSANSLYIAITSALFAFVSFSGDRKSIFLAIVGIAVCALWLCSLRSYKQLSSVKYGIVNEIEKLLPLAPFSYEWEKLKKEYHYTGLTKIEKIVPWLYIFFFSCTILWPLAKDFLCNCN